MLRRIDERAVEWIRRLASALVVVLCAAYVAASLRDAHGDSALRLTLDVVVFVVAAAAVWSRSVIVEREAVPWRLVAAGISCFAIGDAVYILFQRSHEMTPAFGIADPLFLLFYPLVFAGLLGLTRSRLARQGVHRSLWLDGIVAGLGVTSLVSAAIFPTILDALPRNDPLGLVTVLAYPVLDLVLVLLVTVSLAPLGWRPDWAMGLLAAGLTVFAAGDAVFAWQQAVGTYAPNALLECSWVVGVSLIAVSAWTRPAASDELTQRGSRSVGLLIVPAFATLCAIGVMVVDHIDNTSTLAVALAAAALLTALVRAVTSFRELGGVAETHRQARTDELTQLPNRRGFTEFLAEALARRTGYEPLSLLLIDLDGFKEINDSLGHHVGDELLAAIGGRLRSMRDRHPGMHAARLGGDEFGVVLRHAAVHTGARMAGEVRRLLEEPFSLAGIRVRIGASIGVAAYPDHGSEPTTLLRHADVAMYYAKAHRRGVKIYDAAYDRNGRSRLETIDQLRSAIESDGLVLHYQPKVHVDGPVAGVEALVRWAHPERGLLPPAMFLPLIEQTNLLSDLTRRVLRLALAQAREWMHNGMPMPIAVNVTAYDVMDDDFPEMVGDMLESYRVPPHLLMLEVTEGLLVTDPERAERVIGALRRRGIRIALDDFGVEYSSLAQLCRLTIDEIKLDRSFVAGVDNNARARTVVAASVELARAIGGTLVAEGTETAQELETISAMGCQVAQGFLFCEPLPANQIAEWIVEYERSRVEPALVAVSEAR